VKDRPVCNDKIWVRVSLSELREKIVKVDAMFPIKDDSHVCWRGNGVRGSACKFLTNAA
jgi:hypothetical protein